MIRWKVFSVAASFAGLTLPPPAPRVGATTGRDVSSHTLLATDLTLENPR